MSSQTIRVAHLFSPGFGTRFSGHEKRWTRLLSRWGDQSVEHVVLTPSGLVGARQFLGRGCNGTGVWPRTRLGRAGAAASRIVHDRNSFDVLHIHHLSLAGMVAAPSCRLAGRPSIYEISLMGADNPTALRRQRLGHLKYALFKANRGFLCIAVAGYDDCLKAGISRDRIHVLPNPVDPIIFSPVQEDARTALRTKYDIPNDAFVVLFVGSIKARKGVDFLVEVFHRAVPRLGNAVLLLVGPCSSESSPGVTDTFVERLESDVERRGIRDAVRFVGRVDNDCTLADYYRLADASVLPSRREGLGNVILESMATAMPTIASLLPGVTDTVIDNGADGYLLPPDALDEWVNRLVHVRSHREEALAVGAAARTKVLRSFSEGAWEDRLVEVYRKHLV